MKDLYNKLAFTKVLDPVSLTDGGSMNAEIDLKGFNGALVVWHCGASDTATSSNYWTCKIEHADDDGTGAAGSYTAVAAGDIVGATPASGVVFTMNDHATKDSQIYACGYVGGKRYIKVSLNETGTGPTMVQSAMVIKGFPLDSPAVV
jgi:hypothetical protein